MKNWLSKLNPWATIRSLRAQVNYLEGRFDEVSERAEDAERRAFHRASEYWQYQVETAREREKNAMAHVVQLANITPPKFTVVQEAEFRRAMDAN